MRRVMRILDKKPAVLAGSVVVHASLLVCSKRGLVSHIEGSCGTQDKLTSMQKFSCNVRIGDSIEACDDGWVGGGDTQFFTVSVMAISKSRKCDQVK